MARNEKDAAVLQLQLQQGRASLQAAADSMAGGAPATVQPQYATAQDRHVFRNTAKPGYVPNGPQPGAFSQPPTPMEQQVQQAEVTLASPPPSPPPTAEGPNNTRTDIQPNEEPQTQEPKYCWQKFSFLNSVDQRGFYFSVLAILLLIAIFMMMGVAIYRSSEDNVDEQTPHDTLPKAAIPSTPDPTQLPTMPAPTTSASPSDAPSESTAPSGAPTPAPTFDLVAIKQNISSLLPAATLEVIERDPLSPQGRALEFVALDRAMHGEFPEWRILQRFALVTFYHATNGNVWKKKTSWLVHSRPECEWYSAQQGLACYPSAAGTTDLRLAYKRLQLRGNNLQGSLPKEIFSFLPSLERVDLSHNGLSGTLPTQMGAWTNLIEFAATANELTGPLPSEIGWLSNAKKIIIPNNQISGSIPSEIGLLTELESLGMANNELQFTIPTEMASCRALESLSLSNNQLSGPIPSQLGRLAGLEALSLSQNQLRSSIPSELGRLQNLESLLLYNNQLTGTIPWFGEDLQELKEMDATNNTLSGEVPVHFCGRIEFDCNDALCGCDDCPCGAG